MPEKITCQKCGRTKNEKEFFMTKEKVRHDLCKSCLTQHIDNYKPETFEWILKEFDIPYIEEVWMEQVDKILAKKGIANFGPASVIGQYIRMMNMTQYNMFGYADSERINEERRIQKQEEAARRQSIREHNADRTEILQEKLDNGEISEAQFQTLITDNNEEASKWGEKSNQYPTNAQLQEKDLLKELTQEDQFYLMTKWGQFYSASEWVQMEQMYNKYAEEYELNADREETLKKICKVSLKMDQAIDSGDLTGSKSYAGILDTLRKSAKFTEAQNKEEVARELDSIGELIQLCEREGGIIEQFPVNPDEYPQDKVDFTIKDLKAYNYNLVVNELGLGDLIESYIEKLEKREEQDAEDLNNMITSAEEEEAGYLTDEEAIDFQNYLMEELEKDNLLNMVGEQNES